MKCIWLDINASYSHVNLALPALHAQLTESVLARTQWERLFGTVSTPEEELLVSLQAARPHVLMATAYLFNHTYLLHLLASFKALCPTVKVVLGGPEFLGTPAENQAYLQAHPFVDYLFRGEAEEAINKLLEALLTGRGFEAVEGLCYTGVDNGCAAVRDFAGLKAPESSPFFDWNKPFVQLETSRGCFNQCAFCVSGGTPVQPGHDVAALRRRLDDMVAHGVREVRILDRTFNDGNQRTLALLGLFATYAGRIRFHIEVHPALLSAPMLAALQQVPPGLLHVEVGVQSLQPDVLQACGRKGTVSRTLDGLEALLRCGKFEVHSDLIAGLPCYTYDMLFADTLRLMDTGVDEVQLELLKCLPGTRMRTQAAQRGLIYAPTPPYQVLETPWASLSDLQRAMTLSVILDHWYNSRGQGYALYCRKIFTRLLHRNPGLLGAFVEEGVREDWLHRTFSKESRVGLLYDFCERLYPHELPYVSLMWVLNGLSLKKKPGACFRVSKEEPRENAPLVYTLDLPEGRCTLYYDRAIDRHAPIRVTIGGHTYTQTNH